MSRTNILFALEELISYKVLSKHSVGRTGKRGRPIVYFKLENIAFAKSLLKALEELNVNLYGKDWKETAQDHYELTLKERVDL